jgi:hypothetical protein
MEYVVNVDVLFFWGFVSYGKGKGVPSQTRCAPEGPRWFRLPDFHDIPHLKVVSSSPSRTDRLYSQEMFLVLIFTRG